MMFQTLHKFLNRWIINLNGFIPDHYSSGELWRVQKVTIQFHFLVWLFSFSDTYIFILPVRMFEARVSMFCWTLRSPASGASPARESTSVIKPMCILLSLEERCYNYNGETLNMCISNYESKNKSLLWIKSSTALVVTGISTFML